MSIERLLGKRPWATAVLLAAACTALHAAESVEPSEPPLTPGELEIVEMTAVELDGRLPEGVEATGYLWTILDGEGGKLIFEDRQDAVFLAPKVTGDVQTFLLELTVTFESQPPSQRQIRIHVRSSNPADAEPAEDDTSWIDEQIRAEQQAKQQQQQQAPPPSGGGNGPAVSVGVAGGSGGRRSAGVGLRWSMSYPITQPVDVPPPGQTRRPGEGKWDSASRVPHHALRTTFPEEIAERYEKQQAAAEAGEATDAPD